MPKKSYECLSWWFHNCRVIELSNSITSECNVLTTPTYSPEFASECGVYYMAKSLYDLREFRKAAHTLKNCQSDEAFFLRNYCLYMVSRIHYLKTVLYCVYFAPGR